MTTPPAGWYPDPAIDNAQRYWDGTHWTANTAPAAPVVQAMSLDEQRRAIVAGKRWPPVVAGWLGVAALLSILVPGGIAGIVVGALAVGSGAGVLLNARYGGGGLIRGIFAVVAGIVAMSSAIVPFTNLFK